MELAELLESVDLDAESLLVWAHARAEELLVEDPAATVFQLLEPGGSVDIAVPASGVPEQVTEEAATARVIGVADPAAEDGVIR